jgi:hypothetical protein
MLLGSILSSPPSQITINNSPVERVQSFKLPGIVITSNLSWDDHVSAIYLKANKRLHYLKLLKRTSIPVDDLLLYYKSIIRPVIDYACAVWQSGLTVEQRHCLESIQRRASNIIAGYDDYDF